MLRAISLGLSLLRLALSAIALRGSGQPRRHVFGSIAICGRAPVKLRPDSLLAAVAVASFIAVACGQSDPGLPSGPEAMSMLASLGPLRPVEPRFSGLPVHTSCRTLVDGSELWPRPACAGRRTPGDREKQVLGLVGRAALRHSPAPSPDLNHAAGLWLIITSGTAAIEGAVSRLEAAARARPKSAPVLNDLAAAYFVRAHGERRAGDLIVALDTLERALAVNPRLLSARFNRALVLERLGICQAGKKEWAAYLTADRTSGWAREAEGRAARLTCDQLQWASVQEWAGGVGEPPASLDRLLAVAPVDLMRRTMESFLPAWAEAELAGDRAQAMLRLGPLDRLGDALRTRCGDDAVSSLVARIRAAGPEERQRLAHSFRNFGEAARLLAASRYAEARKLFHQAARSVDRDVPVSLWARYWVAASLINENSYAEPRHILASLRSSRIDGLPILAPRLAWSEGLIQLRTGAFADSRRSFDRAAEAYGALGDGVQRAAARALATESLHALGLVDDAWSARVEAFTALGRRPSGPFHNLLLDTAIAAREEGHPHAALLVQSLGVENARAMDSVSRTVEALHWRSKILQALQRDDEALGDLAVALSKAASIPDPAVRSRQIADIEEVRGGLLRTRDPRAAVAALSRAIEFYRGTDYAWKLPSTLLSRARAQLAQGETVLAEVDLEAALGEFERRDRVMPPEVFRYDHFERAQEIFDEMLRLQLGRQRPDLALLYSERARRAFWPRPPGGLRGNRGAIDERVLQQAVAAVPSGVAVVEFVLLNDRLVTWLLYQRKLRSYEQPLGELPEEVQSFSLALASPSMSTAEIARRGETLYRRLVGPWIREVAPGTRLVFAPDRSLHGVAFAALRAPDSHHWLAQDFVVSTTPSLRFAVSAEGPARQVRPAGTALLVGNPRFDRHETGHLAALEGAATEVRQIASLYEGATVLIGEEARRDRVVAALEEADVVHYAGHALANPRNPWATFLALAPTVRGGSGLLLAREIHGLAHRPRRVVVLSACGSASDGRLRAAGFAPLVSSFLSIGAEAVVASLWSVEDRQVLPLTIALHRGLRAGLPADEALDDARRQLMEKTPPASPHLWASLQVTGVARP